MTAAGTSKLEARRRAVEAARRANEARAERDKANILYATNFLYELGKLAEVEVWKKERLAQLREQVAAEAAKRAATHRTNAGAWVARMQGLGENMTTIAARTDVGVGIVRTMLRHAPKDETSTPGGGSHALGAGGVGDDAHPEGPTTSNEPDDVEGSGPTAAAV